MRCRIILLLLLLLSTPALANDRPQVEVVVKPKKRLTKNWVFVIDTSNSTKGVFHKALEGLRFLTQAASDEWKFAVIIFNNSGQERWFNPIIDGKRTKWIPASVDTFALAAMWIESKKQRGTNSKALRALEWALKSKRKDLTVVIIGDGGFTSACEDRGFSDVRKVITNSQAWRKSNKLGHALITTVGITNPHYSILCARCIRGRRAKTRHNYRVADFWKTNIGKKPSDVDCQAFLKEVGTNHKGGYLLVRYTSPAPNTKKPRRALKHGLRSTVSYPVKK